MPPPDPDRTYSLCCAACLQYLGTVYPHQADHLGELHSTRCTAGPQAHAQALVDVVFAEQTGDTTALDNRITNGR
jgi:hypothetical protein